MIYLGSDHRGFELKNSLKKLLSRDGWQFQDLGNDSLDLGDDYVIFARKVAEAVVQSPENKGIVICGSGAGVDMVANKVDGVRSALVFDVPRAAQAREHEDANVLALPADTLDKETAYEIVKTFLNTQFSGQARHIRRLKELQEVEDEHD